MSLKGKKMAFFVEKQYEDLEFWYPYIRMKEENAEVVIIAPKVDIYKGKNGLEVKSDLSIMGVSPDEFNALIIPGGFAPDFMRRSPEMIQFVREMNRYNKWIAAICHAPWMLASAGIIRGKRITSFPSIKDDMVNAGAEWVDQEVVQDGRIITSRNPHDLPAFCKKIIACITQ